MSTAVNKAVCEKFLKTQNFPKYGSYFGKDVSNWYFVSVSVSVCFCFCFCLCLCLCFPPNMHSHLMGMAAVVAADPGHQILEQ